MECFIGMVLIGSCSNWITAKCLSLCSQQALGTSLRRCLDRGQSCTTTSRLFPTLCISIKRWVQRSNTFFACWCCKVKKLIWLSLSVNKLLIMCFLVQVLSKGKCSLLLSARIFNWPGGDGRICGRTAARIQQEWERRPQVGLLWKHLQQEQHTPHGGLSRWLENGRRC